MKIGIFWFYKSQVLSIAHDFDTKNDRAIVYLDKTLLTRSAVDEIFRFFNLNEDWVVLKTDPHYKI